MDADLDSIYLWIIMWIWTVHTLYALGLWIISFQHFGGCTGYGHDDGGGREALDSVFADIFGAESAIIRSQVWSVNRNLFDTLPNL